MRDAPAPRRILDVVQRAHVVQAVGELHQQHADVGRHRQHELAQVLGFLGALRLDFEAAELGDAVDQAGDVLAEQAGDLVARGVGVLDRVVQQAGDDRGGVELHLGQDAGDLDGMGEIGVARGAQLGAVLLQAIDVGAVQHVLVRIRIVGLHALNEFELTNHGNRPLYGDDCAHSMLFARIAGPSLPWTQLGATHATRRCRLPRPSAGPWAGRLRRRPGPARRQAPARARPSR